MQYFIKKCLSLAVSMIMLFTLMAGSVVAAEVSTKDQPMPYLNNPVFYGAKLYARKGFSDKLVATADWSYGAPQAGIIEVPYDKYVEVSAEGYEKWYIKYTGNSKDATYMEIHNGGSITYDKRAFSSGNTPFTFHVLIDGLASKESLYVDWTVGFKAHNIPMGGLEVKFP